MPYADVAAAPGLAWKAAVAAAAGRRVVGGAIGWDWPLLFLLPLVPVGVALAVIDWRTRLLPTRIVGPTYVGLVALVLVGWVATRRHRRPGPGRPRAGRAPAASSGCCGSSTRAGMGFGDVRLVGASSGSPSATSAGASSLVGVYGGFLVFGGARCCGLLARQRTGRCARRSRSARSCWSGALVGSSCGADVWAYLVPTEPESAPTGS